MHNNSSTMSNVDNLENNDLNNKQDLVYHEKEEVFYGFRKCHFGGITISRNQLNKPSKLAITFAYCLALLILGMVVGGVGPTLPGLGRQTNSDVEDQAYLFLSRALGYTIGGYFGGILIDTLSGNRVLSSSLLTIGITSLLTPLCPKLWLLCIVFAFMGGSAGVLDAAVNTLLVWTHEPKELGFYMQTMHAFFAVGAFVSPLITSKVLDAQDGNVSLTFYIQAMMCIPIAILPLMYPSPSNPDKEHIETEEISASGDKESMSANNNVNDEINKMASANILKLTVFSIAAFLFMAVGAEVSCGAWLASFAIIEYDMDEIMASHLTSLFWGAVTLGRILAIPLSLRMTNKSMIYIDCIGGLIGSLLIVSKSSSTYLWVAATFLGISIASLFPSAVSIPGELSINSRGRDTGFYVFGASLGEMFVPFITGHLLSYMASILIICFVSCIIVISLLLYVITKRQQNGNAIKLVDDDIQMDDIDIED